MASHALFTAEAPSVGVSSAPGTHSSSSSPSSRHYGFVAAPRAVPFDAAASERWRHAKVGAATQAGSFLHGASASLSFGEDRLFCHRYYTQPILTNDFCGRRSTRQVSKLHLGRPKAHHGRHSPDAECTFHAITRASSSANVAAVLDVWSNKLYPKEDFGYIIRELGNTGEGLKALAIFKWAIAQEFLKTEWCKLLSITISTLGRLGQVKLAQETFDKAVGLGFGRNVHAYSALVSAYGRSGQPEKAFQVFEEMKRYGCRPNLITYNAVLDACSKGGVEYERAMGFFMEMERDGIEPDRITFNSLLAVCSRASLWEQAQETFEGMQNRGIQPDIVTYNTFLDAVCKAGKMYEAAALVRSMRNHSIMPNVVTYSTLLDGYAKASLFTEAEAVYDEMKNAHIQLDRVSYNTLVDLYANLGKFDKAFALCNQMERAGYKKDVITYNAFLGAYCKQGKYQEASTLFQEMKAGGIAPNLLTYSTLIDAYLKAGSHEKALQVSEEVKKAGLKPDVVLYSLLIDAFCKCGLVEDARSLLDQMIAENILPNVVTFNSLIDAYGRKGHREEEHLPSVSKAMVPYARERPCSLAIWRLKDKLGEEPLLSKLSSRGIHKDILAAIGLFQQMGDLGVKPNVVTFSAVLHACSRCASFKEAALLLEELRKFHSEVYGVAHGLLMGLRSQVSHLAGVLFDEVARMDQSTAKAFYNSLADILWHFGQRRGAQSVVLEARRRHIWVLAWEAYKDESRLDLHSMSVGAAQAMVHAWLLHMRSILFEGYELPKLLSILTGWGRHSKVLGESTVKQAVESRLLAIGAPFQVPKVNEGRLVSTGPVVGGWLEKASTLERLTLHDEHGVSLEEIAT